MNAYLLAILFVAFFVLAAVGALSGCSHPFTTGNYGFYLTAENKRILEKQAEHCESMGGEFAVVDKGDEERGPALVPQCALTQWTSIDMSTMVDHPSGR